MKAVFETNECEGHEKACSFCNRPLSDVGAVLGPKNGPMICEGCNTNIAVLFSRRNAIISEALDIVAAKEADGTYNTGPECDCPTCMSGRMMEADEAFTTALANLAANSIPNNEEKGVPVGMTIQ